MTQTVVTLNADALRANIKRSFDAYCFTGLRAAGLQTNQIGLGALLFQDAALTEWIEVWLLGPAQHSFGRSIGTTTRANRVVYILQASCFLRPKAAAGIKSYRLDQLRDIVGALLHSDTTVPVVDAAGSNSALGSLVCRTVSLDQEVPTPQSQIATRSWVYSVNADWIETWEAVRS